MEGKGRKNMAGGWLLREMQRRALLAIMPAMAVIGFGLGFGLGFMLHGFLVLDTLYVMIAAVAVMVLAFGALYRFVGRIESTWRPGLDAERRVGDRIEHAIAAPGCAFAHDVKEALGGSGNVDHVVMTPAGVWVVETKAHWVTTRRFPAALAQAAKNARRVRRHLKTSLPVRAALVFDKRRDGPFERNHDWEGEPVKVFDAKTFWRALCEERQQGMAVEHLPDSQRVVRMVWKLGSHRHPET